jgi:DNA-binding transcriptional regulator YhcF (GntR family)
VDVLVSIDGSSSVAPFEQVRSQLAAAMRDGVLVAGTRLPSVRAFAQQLGLAVNTVARAYRELEVAGLVSTQGRNGTVVTAGGSTARQRVREAALRYVAVARSVGMDVDEARAMVDAAFATSGD